MRRALLPSLFAAGAGAADPLGPGAGPWAVEAPEAHGLDADALAAAAEHVFKGVPERGCYVVIKDGALVYERYRAAAYNASAHQGYSMTKTLGALVAGWASTHAGLDIDADITQKYGVASPRPYPVTSRQIMSQALDGADGPGEGWAYDAGGGRWINHLIKVVATATGRQPSDIWAEELAAPLGLSAAFSWDADSDWAAGSAGPCRDYARAGQLLLNGGRWPGVPAPLISASYVEQMHTPQTHYAPYANYSNPCYGLLTWLNTNPGSDRGSAHYPGVCKQWPKTAWFPAGSPASVYLAAGLFGQQTMVIPSHGMVVVSMGTSPDDYPLERVIYEGLCGVFPGECANATAA